MAKFGIKTNDFATLVRLKEQMDDAKKAYEALKERLLPSLAIEKKVSVGKYTVAYRQGNSRYKFSSEVVEMETLLKAKKEQEKLSGKARKIPGKPTLVITGGE